MCEVLIRIKASRNPADPMIPGKGCITSRHPDGHAWGTRELVKDPTPENPRVLAVLKIPGLSVSKMDQYCSAHYGPAEVHGTDPEGGLIYHDPIIGASLWTLRLNLVPQWIRDEVAAEGEVTVTKEQIKTYIRRVTDDAEATL